MTKADPNRVPCRACKAGPGQACQTPGGKSTKPHKPRLEASARKTLLLGSLFSGYGGLEQGIAAVTGSETAWVSDIDPGACKILAHRFPDVPNLGDISAIDWDDVDDVDIITGGFPCQDVSHAGRRAGLKRGETRTGLWAVMCRAVDQKRPRLVVAENVKGLLSADADCDLEPCPWCVGDDSSGDMRALGAVLADLADIGYDARWFSLLASDIGAPHQRWRVFVVAYPQGTTEAELAALVSSTFGQIGTFPEGPDGLMLSTPDTMPEAPNHTANAAARKGTGKVQGLGNQIGELIPTPTAMGSESNVRRKKAAGPTLGQALGIFGEDNRHGELDTLPTPTTAVGATRRGNDCGDELPLTGVARELAEGEDLLPTPTGWEQRSDPETDDRNLLPLAVQRIDTLPTPKATNNENRVTWAGESSLNLGSVFGVPCDPDGQCVTCGCPIELHDEGGFCGGPCGGNGQDCRDEGPLLPTPAVNDMGEGKSPEDFDLWNNGPTMAHQKHSSPLSIEVQRDSWGKYGPAIRRWEAVIGRPAPEPTVPGEKPSKDGKVRPRLNPRFVEWMMGLPEGWVTDVPGLGRGAQLKALGNGVVPQQSAAAVSMMLTAAAGAES